MRCGVVVRGRSGGDSDGRKMMSMLVVECGRMSNRETWRRDAMTV